MIRFVKTTLLAAFYTAYFSTAGDKRKAFETEAISLQTKPLDELSKINSEDHRAEEQLSQLKMQLEALGHMQPTDSVLLQEFIEYKE